MYCPGKILHLLVNNPDISLQSVPPHDFTLRIGDIIEITIEHIDKLTNTVL
jgi:fumarylacetoacetate (FAA) hydrolase family protein